jgi:hypothetical protein
MGGTREYLLYYWFRVGEATFAIHHLISDFTPNKNSHPSFSLSALITISIINQLGIKSSHLKAACTVARYMRDWFGKRMRDVRVPLGW